LIIAGISDFRNMFPAMGRMRDILDKKAFTVLVSHNPDFAEKTDLSYFDLMLSGHTHGGQITFFGYAPVLPSEYGQKYRTGTVLRNSVPVIISNGAGFGGNVLRFRIGAPSDFLLITLRSETASGQGKN
jgi:predicted MPP superfamily phosphohydrolase